MLHPAVSPAGVVGQHIPTQAGQARLLVHAGSTRRSTVGALGTRVPQGVGDIAW